MLKFFSDKFDEVFEFSRRSASRWRPLPGRSVKMKPKFQESQPASEQAFVSLVGTLEACVDSRQMLYG